MYNGCTVVFSVTLASYFLYVYQFEGQKYMS